MLKRVLVLLGESVSSVAARDYAFRLARTRGASLSGLAGIDLAALRVPSLGRAGAAAFQMKLEQGMRADADAAQVRLHAAYEAECARNGLPLDWLSFEGDPMEALVAASEARDLLVTGCDTAFQGTLSSPLPDLLSSLLAKTPRPVVVCGDEAPEGEISLIAYDGSLPAMRALQMFVLLGTGRNQPALVVSIDPSRDEAARMAVAAGSYLRAHGYEASELPLTTRVDPSEVLHLEAEARKASTLVMGCYGHRGLKEMLFGSSTGKLVENPPCPLFIYH
ncbi:universal stress protein [Xanthobacter pseudotagetidis]|uniref:universal stress protein n=1 Tax=Xanthobacter pseudotagetidis TaxID=3119911 RepID=UPI00372727AA